MIYVTNDAMEELEKLLSSSDKISGDSFRIVEKDEGVLALVNDTMKPVPAVYALQSKQRGLGP